MRLIQRLPVVRVGFLQLPEFQAQLVHIFPGFLRYFTWLLYIGFAFWLNVKVRDLKSALQLDVLGELKVQLHSFCQSALHARRGQFLRHTALV